MKREYYNQHSDVLNEDMSMIVYGEGGYPVIAFQAQDAKSNNFEDFGMIDVLAPFIEEGRIQVFSVDNLDEQSWSDEGGDKGARAWRQEQYFKFVTDELIPRVHAWNNSDLRPIAVGCSMGATHAAIAAFRRPDLFQGCIALSGVYRTSFFFGDWMDENLYNNDIPAFLTNMPTDHPLNRLGVSHWCDFWGTDVNHDWPWWRKQMPYFMAEVLSDIDAQQEWEQPTMTAEAPKAEEKVEEKAPAKKPAAKRTTTRRAPAKKAAVAKTTAAKKAEAAAEEKVEAAAEEKVEAAKEEAKAATEEAKPATKKPAAKRATTRKTTTKAATTTKATTTKRAATKAAAAKKAEEATAAEEPKAATKATAAKTTATKRATTTKAAAAKTATTKKPAAKRTTTRKTTTAKKADAAE